MPRDEPSSNADNIHIILTLYEGIAVMSAYLLNRSAMH